MLLLNRAAKVYKYKNQFAIDNLNFQTQFPLFMQSHANFVSFLSWWRLLRTSVEPNVYYNCTTRAINFVSCIRFLYFGNKFPLVNPSICHHNNSFPDGDSSRNVNTLRANMCVVNFLWKHFNDGYHMELMFTDSCKLTNSLLGFQHGNNFRNTLKFITSKFNEHLFSTG